MSPLILPWASLLALLPLLLVTSCTQPPRLAFQPSNASIAENRPPVETGALRITIKWPTRDLPNFQAQIIPLRTASLRLTTTDRSGRQLDSQLLTRETGSTATASATIILPAGTGYGFSAEAFAQATPSAGSEPIARGSAINLTIKKGRILSVPIVLSALQAPTITELSPESGTSGTLVTITGAQFGASMNLPFSVSLAGRSLVAQRVNDQTITTTIPPGSTSGNVVVTVDGVPSSTIALFSLLQGLDASVLPLEETFGDNGLGVDVTSPQSGPDHGLDLTIAPAPGAGPTPESNGLDVTIQ